jgi:hypothetical protein
VSRSSLLLGVVALGLAAPAIAHAGSPRGIRSVRWNEVAVPGSICGASGAIRLHHGYAVVRTSRWPRYLPDHRVAVYREEHVAYGDLDGDGVDEAALGIVCANTGGTAAGQLAFAQVIFRFRRESLHVIGIVTPRVHTARDRHVPLVTVDIVPERVVATEYFYGQRDGDCCASGRAKTVWLYRDGLLRPRGTDVTRRAAG